MPIGRSWRFPARRRIPRTSFDPTRLGRTQLAINAPLHGFRVVIVEDEALICLLLEDMLNELGCRVVGVVSSAAAAFAAVTRGPKPDMVLLDLNLDGTRSYRVADFLLEQDIPFVIVTGYGEGAVPERYRSRPILHKPFQPDDLRRALASLGSPHPSPTEALGSATHVR